MHTLSQKLNKLLSDRAELDLSLARNLQKSILQEAIQGKLVPQIADEGTAEKLLAEIRKEKERLIKEGKLKKSALSDSIIYKGDDNKYSTIRKIVLFTHIYTYCPSFLLECRSNEQSAYLLFLSSFLFTSITITHLWFYTADNQILYINIRTLAISLSV